MKTLLIVTRWFIAIILILAALGKMLDLKGYYDVLITYQLFPDFTLWPIVIFMPLLELFIAFSMISKWQLHNGALASILLHAAFAVVLVFELLRGTQIPNCGCFGVFMARPLTWATPVEDIMMIGLSYFIYRSSFASAKK